MSIALKLAERSIPEPNSGCLLWLGTVTDIGYGQMYLPETRKMTYVHRLSWEEHNGLIPDGRFVCHKCDVRSCIEPSHLFLGTQKENLQDMRRKGRGLTCGGIGSKRGNAVLTKDDVLMIRADTRKQRIIAQDYGIAQSTVNRIKNRKAWFFLPPPQGGQ